MTSHGHLTAPQEGCWSKHLLAIVHQDSISAHFPHPAVQGCPSASSTVPCRHCSRPWSTCCANPSSRSLLSCWMSSELLELFALLGWCLIPASLTLGWPLKGRTTEREGHTGACGWHKAGGETMAQLPLSELAPVLRGAQGTLSRPVQAWQWAGLGGLHCVLPLLLTLA